jgi:hypothetical protein
MGEVMFCPYEDVWRVLEYGIHNAYLIAKTSSVDCEHCELVWARL